MIDPITKGVVAGAMPAFGSEAIRQQGYEAAREAALREKEEEAKRRKRGMGAAMAPNAAGAPGSAAASKPAMAMKKGGVVRGDGCCVRGKTKGRLR